jgi:hypothetical protein
MNEINKIFDFVDASINNGLAQEDGNANQSQQILYYN